MWPFKKQPQQPPFSGYTRGLTLVQETRWSRTYCDPANDGRFLESRFRDGSASITLAELTQQWAIWSELERIDFSLAFAHYRGPDLAEILRFLMAHGDSRICSTIAMPIAIALPAAEAVAFLRTCCETQPPGKRANYFQALWITKSAAAVRVLESSLEETWQSLDLMKPIAFYNFITFDAIWCIDALIRLGYGREQLRDTYATLKTHPSMSREVVRWPSEHFGERPM